MNGMVTAYYYMPFNTNNREKNMKNKFDHSINRLQIAGAILALGGLIAPAKATTIEYQSANNGAGNYTYVYTVDNNTAYSINDFTIYFPDVTCTTPTFEYSSFSEGATVAGWTFLSAEGSAIALNGFVDWNNSAGIAAGQSLAGFTVSFTYSGSGMPGSQYFETFYGGYSLVDSGMTTPVPEPSTWLAEAFAVIFLAGCGIGRKPCCKKD